MALDDLHRVALLELSRQSFADVAAPRDHDPLVRLFEAPEFTHDGPDVPPRGNEENLVVGLDYRIALRGNDVISAIDGCNARVDVGDVCAQCLELLMDERAVSVGLDRHQLQHAVGEVDDLQRPRILDESFNLIGHDLLGIDEHVDGHVFLGEEAGAGRVCVCAHPSDLHGGAEQRIADLTGHHVHFVGICHRHEEIGVFGSGPPQDVRMRSHALNRLDIEAVAEFAQSGGIAVNHRDVGILFREILCEGTADLASA